jgi:UDP-galactopyranose mutase
MAKYDFLIVGAGPFGCTFAAIMREHGRKCLVIAKRQHVAGNAFTRREQGIDVQVYGAHIFHTEDEHVWHFVSRFGRFNNYRHIVRCRIGERVYSFPFNLLTLNQVLGIKTPREAREWYAQLQVENCIQNVDRLKLSIEEFCRGAIGATLYELFVKGYTQKQWNADPAYYRAHPRPFHL